MSFIKWLIKSEKISLINGLKCDCYVIDYEPNDDELNSLAKYLINQYITEEELNDGIDANCITKKEYLERFVLPSKNRLGLALRSGDFGEIIINDIVEYLYDFKSPRIRLKGRATNNAATQGIDFIGYKLNKDNNNNDELIIAEVKTRLSDTNFDVCKDAIIDSLKRNKNDIAIAIEYYRKACKKYGYYDESNDFKRFSLKSENDYKIIRCAGSVSSANEFEDTILFDLPESLDIKNLNKVILVRGKTIKQLVNDIYERCFEI